VDGDQTLPPRNPSPLLLPPSFPTPDLHGSIAARRLTGSRWFRQIMIHIGGHCGFEIAPFVPQIAHLLELAGLMVGVTSGAVNNVKHHDMHHQHPKYHFSLYFTHWDYLLGSMHPEYVRTHPCWWSRSTPPSSAKEVSDQ